MRTINLSILSTAFSGHAKEESNYKRLQRFLREFEMPYAELSLFIVKLLGVAGPYTLALDRTNWKVGAVDLNILMLSIVYRGVGIPVVWTVLPKAGNSDTSERTTVIEIFLDLFGAQNIVCLLGHRTQMVSLSQAPSDQVSDAPAQEHAGSQRAETVCACLAVVLSDAHQLSSGHS